MGVGFNWFKNYKIIEHEICYGGLGKDVEYGIEYLDGDSTSHSYGNRSKLQDIFRKYLNVEIPTIDDYDYKEIELIEPCIMSNLCTKLLENKEYDLEAMEDRIQWIKELSDKGYYVSYDVD